MSCKFLYFEDAIRNKKIKYFIEAFSPQFQQLQKIEKDTKPTTFSRPSSD